ncbi:MAG: asparaginase domain-containing protein [Acidimicrobiales bacterium]
MAPDSDPEILADGGARTPLPRIAVFAGPNATILNSPPLVTGRGRSGPHGVRATAREPGLWPQRLAAPVTVFVEALSAHPLEHDAGDLYGPPDAWIDEAGAVQETEVPGSTAAYRVVLQPSDGLYLLPYVASQADGSPWDDTGTESEAPRAKNRQTFYPDASRLYEEIDRFGVGYAGRGALLSSQAHFDHYRAAPSGGWTTGRPHGEGSLERDGEDFFAYFPHHLATEPTTTDLAAITNQVQRVMASGRYQGAQWLEGNPTIEETLYWLGLLIDTTVPIVGHAAQRPHLAVGADGDRNIVDGVAYIASGVWADQGGADRLGAVLIVDEVVLSARQVAKSDARPGNYVAVGGHGGVVASFGGDGPIHLTFVPVRRHTYCSDLRLSTLPASVDAVRDRGAGPTVEPVATLTGSGELRAEAIPHVTIHTYARYRPAVPPGVSEEPAIGAEIADNLLHFPLAGFVGEGNSPYVTMHPSTDVALRRAVFSGMAVVKVGRGHPGGDAHRRDHLFIAGNDLTATKARLLLMAAMLKLGAMPPAADPTAPPSTRSRPCSPTSPGIRPSSTPTDPGRAADLRVILRLSVRP